MKTKIYELPANLLTSRKQVSFYGKALVQEEVAGEDKETTLLSYGTPIISIRADRANKVVIIKKHWFDWSVTTSRHIEAFCNLYGLKRMNKKEWLNLPSEQIISFDEWLNN